MTNLKIIHDNLAKTAALVASSEAGALVAGNLQKDSKTVVWRSTGTTATLTATFAAAAAVGGVSLPITNLTANATMRVRCYAAAGDPSPTLDTGALPCCGYSLIDKIDFASGPLNANTFAYGGGTYATLFFSAQTAQKVVIDIADAGNPAGYIDASYLVIGKVWTPENNAEYGAALSFNDSSRHTRSEAGDLMTDRGARYKSLSFTLSDMAAADRTELMQLLIRNGMAAPLFVSLFPASSDAQEKQVYQLYGKQTKLDGIKRIRYGTDQTSLEIEEL